MYVCTYICTCVAPVTVVCAFSRHYGGHDNRHMIPANGDRHLQSPDLVTSPSSLTSDNSPSGGSHLTHGTIGKGEGGEGEGERRGRGGGEEGGEGQREREGCIREKR